MYLQFRVGISIDSCLSVRSWVVHRPVLLGGTPRLLLFLGTAERSGERLAAACASEVGDAECEHKQSQDVAGQPEVQLLVRRRSVEGTDAGAQSKCRVEYRAHVVVGRACVLSRELLLGCVDHFRQHGDSHRRHAGA